MSVLFLFLCIFSLCVSLKVLLVSIPAAGHFLPLAGQATELLRRGHSVWLASGTGVLGLVRLSGAVLVPLDGPEETDREIIFQRAMEARSMLESAVIVEEWLASVYKRTFDQLEQLITGTQFDLIVADAVSRAAIDLADKHNIVCVINNADLLGILGSDVIGKSDSLPPIFSGTPINSLGFLFRAFFPFLRILELVAYPLVLNPMYNALRFSQGLSSRSIAELYLNKAIITASYPGIDYARSIPPNIFYVGVTTPMQFIANETDPLNQFLGTWFESKGSESIVYVNMGTIVELPLELLTSIFTGLLAVLRVNTRRVLWKLKQNLLDLLKNHYEGRFSFELINRINIFRVLPLNESHLNADAFLLTAWLPETHSVLARLSIHPLQTLQSLTAGKRNLFVSHCGVNSVHEALLIGVPVLCIPLFCDQGDIGQRLVDHHIGGMLAKENVNTNTFHASVESFLDELKDLKLKQRIASAQNNMILAGGAKRAVDVIEHTHAHGVVHLVPLDMSRERVMDPYYFVQIFLFTKEFLAFWILAGLFFIQISLWLRK